MDTSHVRYCARQDVNNRLYPGQSASQQPSDPARDAIIDDAILSVSRRFENETGRRLNGFAPIFETRLFSGKGQQTLQVDEFATMRTIEFNATVVGSPNWTDITGDLTTGNLTFKPLRFWPKRLLFRVQTFITDPYETGNYRFTAIWGCVQPDLMAQPPTGQTSAWQGLTDAQIKLLAPNPAGPVYGWWVTPNDVRVAIADWALYEYHSGRSGKGDQAGRPGATGAMFLKSIPPNVADVIRNYRGSKAKLALIGIDGSDPREEAMAGSPLGGPHRWAGWHSYDPTGQHPENTW